MRTRLRMLAIAFCLAVLPVFASAQGVSTKLLSSAGSCTSNTYTISTLNMPTVTVLVEGVFSGTLTFKASTDGTNFSVVSLTPIPFGSATSTPGLGAWYADNMGVFTTACVYFSSYTSGTAVVSMSMGGPANATSGKILTGLVGSGPIPAVSNTTSNSCGTTAAAMATGSSNSVGAFTVGGTSGTSCTLTFTFPAPHNWACYGNDTVTAATAVQWLPLSTTTGKFVATFVAADVISYICAAY